MRHKVRMNISEVLSLNYGIKKENRYEQNISGGNEREEMTIIKVRFVSMCLSCG